MSISYERLADLRIGDLSTFLAVRRTASITAAARELDVSPSQVSKAISRLETQLRMKLLIRGARGVTLSEPARRIVPHVEAVLELLRDLRRPDPRPTPPQLTIAAEPYLCALLLPPIAAAVPHLRVRGLEVPPAITRAYAGERLFDLAILAGGTERMPPNWSTTSVGYVRKALFGTRAMAKKLGPPPVAPDDLRTVPFITPIYSHEGQLVPIDDDCPLVPSERVLGHQVQTIPVALDLAAAADQLVFGPAVAARRHLDRGALVEIRVRGWHVHDPCFVAVNGDRVLSNVRSAIVKALRVALASEADAV